MRIAVLTTSWPTGPDDPSGHFVRAEVRALERAGSDVVVFAPEPGGAFGWPGVAARVRERPLRAIEALRWVAESRRRLARMRPEKIVAHWAVPCGWPIASVARRVDLEVVSHGGDVRLLTALPSAARHAIVASLVARAASWRFVSESLLLSLTGNLDGKMRGKLEAIAVVRPPPLEMPDVRGAATRRRASLGGLRVAVTVGRLVSSKRIDRCIEHVAGAGELDALVVVGDGPERSRLETLARRLGVDARFVGLVSRQEALAWIGAADFLLHASEAEGMSTVLREAEALGTPVTRLDLPPSDEQSPSAGARATRLP